MDVLESAADVFLPHLLRPHADRRHGDDDDDASIVSSISRARSYAAAPLDVTVASAAVWQPTTRAPAVTFPVAAAAPAPSAHPPSAAAPQAPVSSTPTAPLAAGAPQFTVPAELDAALASMHRVYAGLAALRDALLAHADAAAAMPDIRASTAAAAASDRPAQSAAADTSFGSLGGRRDPPTDAAALHAVDTLLSGRAAAAPEGCVASTTHIAAAAVVAAPSASGEAPSSTSTGDSPLAKLSQRAAGGGRPTAASAAHLGSTAHGQPASAPIAMAAMVPRSGNASFAASALDSTSLSAASLRARRQVETARARIMAANARYGGATGAVASAGTADLSGINHQLPALDASEPHWAPAEHGSSAVAHVSVARGTGVQSVLWSEPSHVPARAVVATSGSGAGVPGRWLQAPSASPSVDVSSAAADFEDSLTMALRRELDECGAGCTPATPHTQRH